jgi:hypothetical protein
MSRVMNFFASEISELWNVLTAYRPERHYMRGPGPKWREKHASGEPPMRIDGSDRVVSAR